MSLTKRRYEQSTTISMCICHKKKDGACSPCTRECRYCFDELVLSYTEEHMGGVEFEEISNDPLQPV